jgi:L-amino acid N-acyltransferase YncA
LAEAPLTANVRPATAADLGAVASIYAWYVANSVATFDETPRSAEAWTALLDRQADLGLPFVVAQTAGRIAGYGYAGPWRSRAGYRYTVEDSIFVAPDLTGQGAGRSMLSQLVAACEQAGMRQMVAVIAATQDPSSVLLHEALGFGHAGRLYAVGFKNGQWIDTILMQRALG